MLAAYPEAVNKHCSSLPKNESSQRDHFLKLDTWIWSNLVPKLERMNEPFLQQEEFFKILEYRLLRDVGRRNSLFPMLSIPLKDIESATRQAFRRIRESAPVDSQESPDNLKSVLSAVDCLKPSPRVQTAPGGLKGMTTSMALSILSVVDPTLPFFDDKIYVAVLSTAEKDAKPKHMSRYLQKDVIPIIAAVRKKAVDLGWTARQVNQALWACKTFESGKSPLIQAQSPGRFDGESKCAVTERVAIGTNHTFDIPAGDTVHEEEIDSQQPLRKRQKK
ncbi:hypothetical protein HDU67_006609 [Dinochytrium kinnereticum]|nr:hypothetical protein HDU67_006609 [Dinochytrium kinnereticum]